MFFFCIVWLKWFSNETVSGHLNLVYPRSDIQEAALWGHIVQQQDSVSFPEIWPSNTPESEGGKSKFILNV